MKAATSDDDRIWRALADPTRRRLLDVLAQSARTTGDLVACVPDLSRTGVMKHLDVLEAAGLVVVRREGRVRWNHLNPVPIQRIHDRWVARHVRDVAGALSRLEDHVESRTPRRTRKRTKTRTKTRTR
jgi:DNA-binding transcriptional ArsR family regulator